MEINSQVNTFIGGMNIDSDITMLADNQYRWAENIRLLTDNAGTTGGTILLRRQQKNVVQQLLWNYMKELILIMYGL